MHVPIQWLSPGKTRLCPVGSTEGSAPESPLGCCRVTARQVRVPGVEKLEKWDVLEHSSHGVTLELFRGCCPGKKPKSLGCGGVSWAQFGFVEPSQASAVISVPMEGPAHGYQQGLCTLFQSWACVVGL